MNQLAQKEKKGYVVLPRKLAEKAHGRIDILALRKKITREWQGNGAVEEIRKQRKRA